MAVKVMIPTPLRVYAAKKDSAEVSAQTVGEALGGLDHCNLPTCASIFLPKTDSCAAS